MQTKTLCILHIYINADYKIHDFSRLYLYCTPAAKQQMFHKQTLEIRQVKQMATLKYNYSSSQTAEFYPSLRVSRGLSTLQP